MTKIYLDSNFFVTVYESRKANTAKHCQDYEVNREIINLIQNGKLKAVTSWYTFAEVITLLKKSYRKHHNYADGVVPEEIRKEIFKLAEKIIHMPNLTVTGGDVDTINKTPEAVTNVCIDSYDVIHFIIADKLNVDCLVTEDVSFKKYAKQFIETKHPAEFLEEISRL